jgi:two-component sensor histidine kinase/CheY-like chemotaxis protein
MSFLAGNSEMARRIREKDWSLHPFGATTTWPQSLRSALSICLHSAFPTAIYWGSELRLLYNDAWAPIPGPRHPAALGAPAQEVWSDIWHIIEPQFTHLIATGEGIFVEDQMLPMRRFGVTEETYWNYSFTPIRGEDGSIAGVFNSGSETTRTVLLQRQMRFLLDLGEAFRSSADSQAARRTSIEMLGKHISADRVGLRELVSGATGELAVADEWTAPGVPPVGSSVRFADLGAWVRQQLAGGHVLRIDDVATDPGLAEARQVFVDMGVGAVVAVPWVEAGKTSAVIYLHSREPRAWSDFDVTTAEKVLERTLTWVERERAAEREKIMMREIDHRARNALAVVQSVVRLTAAGDVQTFRAKIDDRVSALSRSHALLSSKRWGLVELSDLLDLELAPYTEGGSVRARAEGPSVPLRPEQAQTMALLFHELTTNAAKHGALNVPGGSLEVAWRVDDGNLLMVDWAERVPGTLRAGERSGGGGFGSTLLSRVVERQLGGSISRSIEDGGLRCLLKIPLSESRTGAASGAKVEADATGSERDRKRILIVEDESIVAMDLEDIVDSLGYAVFATVSSLTAGLDALEAGTPDLAIVDMNLAGHSSRPIAEALSDRGVPVIFATGYTEVGDLPPALVSAPRLTKPISEIELRQAIGEILH